MVGSSGCTTQPHLHFVVRDESGRTVDPFQIGICTDPPGCEILITIMDYIASDTPVNHWRELKDAPPNIRAIKPRSLCVGIVVAGVDAGTRRFRFVVKNGNTVQHGDLTSERYFGHS